MGYIGIKITTDYTLLPYLFQMEGFQKQIQTILTWRQQRS